MEDQGIDSLPAIVGLSDKDITVICGVSRRSGGFVGRKMPDRGSQIFLLAANNLKLAALRFKLMEY